MEGAARVFVQLIGGIGLFLMGMILMTDWLKALAGDSMRRIKPTASPDTYPLPPLRSIDNKNLQFIYRQQASTCHGSSAVVSVLLYL